MEKYAGGGGVIIASGKEGSDVDGGVLGGNDGSNLVMRMEGS